MVLELFFSLRDGATQELTEWAGRKMVFGSRSGRADRKALGPQVLSANHIFSRPARPE